MRAREVLALAVLVVAVVFGGVEARGNQGPKQDALAPADSADLQPLPGAVPVKLALDDTKDRELKDLFAEAENEGMSDKAISVATESLRVTGEIVDPTHLVQPRGPGASANAIRAMKAMASVDNLVAQHLRAAAADATSAPAAGADANTQQPAANTTSGSAAGSTTAAPNTTTSSADAAPTTKTSNSTSTSVTYKQYVEDPNPPSQGDQDQFPVPYDVFRKFDKDNDGRLNYAEFHELVNEVHTDALPSGLVTYSVTLECTNSSGGPVYISFVGPADQRTATMLLSEGVADGRTEYKVSTRDVAYPSAVILTKPDDGNLWEISKVLVRAHNYVATSTAPRRILRTESVPLVSSEYHLEDSAFQQAAGGDVQDLWTKEHYAVYLQHVADFQDFVAKHIYEQHMHNLDVQRAQAAAEAASRPKANQALPSNGAASGSSGSNAPPPPPASAAAGSPAPATQQTTSSTTTQQHQQQTTTTTTQSSAQAAQAAEAVKAQELLQATEQKRKAAEKAVKEKRERSEMAYKDFIEKMRRAQVQEQQDEIDHLLAERAKRLAEEQGFKDAQKALRDEVARARAKSTGGDTEKPALAYMSPRESDDLAALQADVAKAEHDRAVAEGNEHVGVPLRANPLRGVPPPTLPAPPQSATTEAERLQHSPYMDWMGKLPPHVQAEQRMGGWNYENPREWAGACDVGKMQSPIALVVSQAPVGSLERSGDTELLLHFARARYNTLAMEHNGHALVVDGKGLLGYVESGSERVKYVVDRVEFHGPSEHTTDYAPKTQDGHFSMEMQIWTRKTLRSDAGQDWLVLSVFFQADPQAKDNSFLRDSLDWDHLPDSPHAAHALAGFVDLSQADGARMWASPYFSYLGSQTTPGCEENVSWRVLREPESMSKAQITAFDNIFRLNLKFAQGLGNNRPLQDKNARRVVLSSKST